MKKLIYKFLGILNDSEILMQAEAWAKKYYQPEYFKIASIVMFVLHDQGGVNIPKTSPSSRFIEDLDLRDPLVQVEIISGIEEKFNIVIPDNKCEQFNRINDLIEYIKKSYQIESANQLSALLQAGSCS